MDHLSPIIPSSFSPQQVQNPQEVVPLPTMSATVAADTAPPSKISQQEHTIAQLQVTWKV